MSDLGVLENVSREPVMGPAGQPSRPSKAEQLAALHERAQAMVGILRERAAEAERLRRVPDQTIKDFIKAGFFKILMPTRFDGFELDFGTAQIHVAGELGRGCGSSAWVCTVLACQAMLSAMFPLQAQQDMWSESSDNLVCCSYKPEHSEFVPVAGGYRASGLWKFASGVDSSGWALLGGNVKRDAKVEPVWALIPARDYQVIDTWYAGGLKGTGSKDVAMEGQFVPEHRVVPLRALMEGRGPGAAVNPCHLYRLPAMGVIGLNLVTPLVGIAQGAVEIYAEQARAQPMRPGAPRRADNELNQLQVSEAAVLVDGARTLLLRNTQEMNDTLRSGAYLSGEQRARFRRDTAFCAQMCVRAVDIIQNINGAHGIFDDNPIQRALRDAYTLRTHIGVQWRLAGTGYGRTALGLPPVTEG